eukprot:766168-Hanusia_phi.AAC.4
MAAWGRLVSLNKRWQDIEISQNKMKFGRNSACQVPPKGCRSETEVREREREQREAGGGGSKLRLSQERAVVGDYSSNGLYVNGTRVGRGNRQSIQV